MSMHHSDALNSLQTAQDFWRYAATQMYQADLFFGHGTTNAWDEAGALVMQALHLPPEHISHVAQCRLTNDEKQRVLHWLEQRISQRLPLPYISGKAYFCGLEFIVDHHVLIPRSPIGELIQKGFQPWLGEREVNRVLDLCCGSACIAIACAYAAPHLEIIASDISPDALQIAEKNIAKHRVSDRVQLRQSNCLQQLKGEKFDLIVCNPPYVDAQDMASLPDEYHHEPALALASGDDGLNFVRELLATASQHLNPGGLLFCEVGNSIQHMFEQFPNVPFTWIDFEHGDDGVFLISREELLSYFG
jgi:ribosomal protein L3 glutamine methyltransferase